MVDDEREKKREGTWAKDVFKRQDIRRESLYFLLVVEWWRLF
jgi:hypothetical protein